MSIVYEALILVQSNASGMPLTPISLLTFPPRTSSPMIRHAAVCIVLVALTMAGDVIVEGRRGENDDDKELVAAGAKVDGR